MADSVHAIALILALTLSFGCEPAAEGDVDVETDGANMRALVGATVLDGTGADPIKDAVVLVRDGRVQAVGPASAVDVPESARVIDLAGKFVVPGLINTHGHVGGTLGLNVGHYSRENLLRQLGLYARYGVTTVVSLGGDELEGVELRNEQEATDLDRSRLFVAGAVVTGDTPGEAVEVVDANAGMGADFIKIRIDDNLGSIEKMAPDVYRAVIDRAHELELPVAAHLFYLEDARSLLDAGADFLVHSVRDRDVDPDLARQLVEQGVCYSPTLTREYVMYAYEEIPGFFSDPFFLSEADSAVLAELSDPLRMADVSENESAQRYKEALVQAKRNLGTLSAAGVTIAMGTDTGPPSRFQGYFEHLELELMAEAGMSTMEILVASTADAARCIGRDDIGSLAPGKWADLIVLGADPLEDVVNLRSIEAVWVAGNPVPGVAR